MTAMVSLTLDDQFVIWYCIAFCGQFKINGYLNLRKIQETLTPRCQLSVSLLLFSSNQKVLESNSVLALSATVSDQPVDPPSDLSRGLSGIQGKPYPSMYLIKKAHHLWTLKQTPVPVAGL